MRIELERSGGFVGRTVRWSLDTDQLQPAEAREIDALLAGAGSWASPPAGGADRFHYRLRVLSEHESLDVSFDEPMPAAARPLLDRLRRSSPG